MVRVRVVVCLRLFIFWLFVLWNANARAQKSFEALLSDAQRAGDLAVRLDPLYADCKRDDDLETRQCSVVRELAAERVSAGTFTAVGDDAALTWTPWSSGEKTLSLEVHGCLACGKPLQIGDKTRFVTTRVPKSIKGAKAVGLEVGFHNVPLPDQATAARWVKDVLPRLRVQFVFKVGPAWKSGAFEGVTFVPLGHRVFDRCTGKVWASDPPSEKLAATMKEGGGCPEERKQGDEDLPDSLSREQVVKTMRSVEPKIHDCYREFQEGGTVTVKLTVQRDGRFELAILPPFDKTPTGYCVRNAMQSVSFPRFRGEKFNITYPFMLR